MVACLLDTQEFQNKLYAGAGSANVGLWLLMLYDPIHHRPILQYCQQSMLTVQWLISGYQQHLALTQAPIVRSFVNPFNAETTFV